jgi:iron complex transport system ATP-binding protein
MTAQGRPEDVLTPETLTRVYGVPVTVERLAQGRSICAPTIIAQRRRR